MDDLTNPNNGVYFSMAKNIGITFVLTETETLMVWADECKVSLTRVVETIQAVIKGKAPMVTTMLSKMRPWAKTAHVGSRPAGVSEFSFEVNVVQGVMVFRRANKMPLWMPLTGFLDLSLIQGGAIMREASDIVLYRGDTETLVTTDGCEPLAIREFFKTRKRANYKRIEIDAGHTVLS